ncbi:class I SAM-dependent methyltransferase [Vagococcus carniphilus]|uniref:Class I SAM-dependent methyltransferase n=1 Tax=Vagococcus carniphilus TaxID=218144 RepID=A0AAW8U545_9ENTE|nr:class I SAM-dependent methyltransferase [Vagococcus carniphilus]MDT2833344.1 class I SAM-dependent methyltransferase [Vagococcus carniphilus]
MGNHYYTNQPEVAHDRKKWTFPLRGKNFTFITDSNVFSKGTVDFGSRVLIDAFDDTNLPEGDILDVGCGYGPIGLSLAHSTGRHVEMVDVNERAVELAKENADLNGIKHVTIYPSNIYEKVKRTDFVAVVSNPPIRAGKSVVHGIIEESYDKLVKSGTLTIVIQKKQGAPSAKKKMEEIFGNAEVVAKEKGYFIIVSEK